MKNSKRKTVSKCITKKKSQTQKRLLPALQYNKTVNQAVVQEYLEGDLGEYTTGVFSNGQDVFSITFKRTLGYGGLSKIVEIKDDKNIENLARSIAQKSKLIGSINIQSRKRGDDYVVFEINPRFSSTVYFRHYFGFQDVIWWLETIMKQNVVYHKKYIQGVGVRTSNEVFFNLEHS